MNDASQLLPLFSRMLLIRSFEERVAELFEAGRIYGHVHLSVGQEAVAVGVCSNLRDEDFLTSHHRGHGHCLAKGADPRRMMAELFGRSTGYCKGKGGSMHVADASRGILGANGIVAGGTPHAVGAALGLCLQGKSSVVAAFFGDGALNQGVLHEAMNLAAIWKLPVVFVCENNRYAITTDALYATAGSMEDRGRAYGMPAVTVDGMDLLAVSKAAAEAVERARRGEGPSFIGCVTYRFRGHTEGEQRLGWAYRSAEELEQWRQKDPILRLESHLLGEGLLTPEQAQHLREQARAAIDDAVAFAESSPEPGLEEAFEDVYA